MTARLSLEEIRYFPWKGKTFSQITATLRRNGLYNSASFNVDPRLSLKPGPLKIYRKEIASITTNKCNRRTQVFDFETPGNNVVNSKIQTNTNGTKNTIDPTLPNILGEYPGSACDATSTQDGCLSSQNNALRRVRSLESSNVISLRILISII